MELIAARCAADHGRSEMPNHYPIG